MRHECKTNETRMKRVKNQCNPSATQTTWLQCKCYASNTSATRVKHFDFDNDKSENIFSHPHFYYMASERLQGEEQFYSKKYLLEMLYSHDKMRLKNSLQKLDIVMAKAISKSYTLALDCSWKMPLHVPAY